MVVGESIIMDFGPFTRTLIRKKFIVEVYIG